MYKKLKYELTGVGKGLMPGNARMANPYDEFAIALAKVTKRTSKATDADRKEIARLSFMGSLYMQGGVPGIPESVLIATIARGCGYRTGEENTKYRLALKCPEGKDFFPLIYAGSKNPEELWKEKEKFSYSRLMEGKLKTNAVFPEWRAVIELEYNDEELDEKDVNKAIVKAGKEGHLMAWRRGGWGQFEVKRDKANSVG